MMKVECYAGYKADERPLRFQLQGRPLDVVEVQDRWYSLGATYFRVIASDRNIYVLKHDARSDEWTLEAFRNTTHGVQREREQDEQFAGIKPPPF